MELKPYWVLVAGFVVLLMFVISIRLPRGQGRGRRLGPGGVQHLLGFGFGEGFASGSGSGSGSPTFTMFGVDWCGHCKRAKPLFESLGPTVTIDGQAVALRHVNPEKEPDAAKGYEIQGYPTFYFEKNGQKKKYEGSRTPAGFHAFLKKELAA